MLRHIIQFGNGTAQVLCNSSFLGHAVEILQELHGIAALLGVLVEPDVMAHSDALILVLPHPLGAGSLQYLASGAEPVHQISVARFVTVFCGHSLTSQLLALDQFLFCNLARELAVCMVRVLIVHVTEPVLENAGGLTHESKSRACDGPALRL